MSDTKNTLPVAARFFGTKNKTEWQAPHGEECIEQISAHIPSSIWNIYVKTVFTSSFSDTAYRCAYRRGQRKLPLETPRHFRNVRS